MKSVDVPIDRIVESMCFLKTEEREKSFQDHQTEHHGTGRLHNGHRRYLGYVLLSCRIREEGNVARTRHCLLSREALCVVLKREGVDLQGEG